MKFHELICRNWEIEGVKICGCTIQGLKVIPCLWHISMRHWSIETRIVMHKSRKSKTTMIEDIYFLLIQVSGFHAPSSVWGLEGLKLVCGGNTGSSQFYMFRFTRFWLYMS